MNIAFMLTFTSIIMLVLIFVLFFLGRWVYMDAKAKGLSPGAWTAITLLAPGFIGLVLYLVYRSDKKPQMPCVSCGSSIDQNVSFCPYCGYQPSPVAVSLTTERIPRRVIYILIGSVCFFFALLSIMAGVAVFSGAMDVSADNPKNSISASYSISQTVVSEQSVSDSSEGAVYESDNNNSVQTAVSEYSADGSYDSKNMTSGSDSTVFGNRYNESISLDKYNLTFDSLSGPHNFKLEIPETGAVIKLRMNYNGEKAYIRAFVIIEDVETEIKASSINTSVNKDRHSETMEFDIRGYAGHDVNFFIAASDLSNGHISASIE